MNNFNSIILFLASIVVSLASCNYSEDFQVIDHKEFTIEVPSYMKSTNQLRDDAILQYASRYRNIYVIVLKDAKSEGQDIRSYRNDAIEIIKTYVDEPIITDSSAFTLNGNNAIKSELFGKIEEQNVYYDHATVDGGDSYYQLCVWTRGAERRMRYKDDMNKIINSFKLQ